jgi:hypothetical protein
MQTLTFDATVVLSIPTELEALGFDIEGRPTAMQ